MGCMPRKKKLAEGKSYSSIARFQVVKAMNVSIVAKDQAVVELTRNSEAYMLHM
jgi:hypothetical protein